MIGQTLAHYRVLEELGAGGMGTVYRAEDLRLLRPVAIKVLSPVLLAEPGALDWFKREARVAAGLNHPNICTIHDVGDDAGRPFLVMELLDGKSLRELLYAGALPREQVLNLGIGIAEALEAAHAQRIIHRDLKPANVIVSNDGRHAKVLDFGLAQLLADHPPGQPVAAGSEADPTPSVLTQTRAGAGTPAYVSPEQARGEPLDERTDIFSFGAVLYEMATGQKAFPGATPAAVFDAVLNRAPAAAATLNPELSAELTAVITRALEKDREARYATAAGLAFDLRRIRRRLEGASSSGATGSALGYRRFWRRPRERALAFAVLAVAATGARVAIAQRLTPPPLTERDFVLLADFANNTGDAVFDLTLREALAVQLSQSPFLAIVPDDRVRDTLRMMRRSPDERLTHALAREVCERTGAKAMLEGQLDTIGTSYVATLDAIGCSDRRVARARAGADRTARRRVLRALGPMASSMRAQARRVARHRAQVRRADRGTRPRRSLEALKAYALGVAQRAKGDDIGAIPFLEHAVMLDPSFASAHSALSAVYGSLGEPAERARPRAARLRQPRHVSERERLFIEYQHYDATGDERRAAEILEVWKQLYPRDYRAPPTRSRSSFIPLRRVRARDRGGARGRAPQPGPPVPALEPGLRLPRTPTASPTRAARPRKPSRARPRRCRCGGCCSSSRRWTATGRSPTPRSSGARTARASST